MGNQCNFKSSVNFHRKAEKLTFQNCVCYVQSIQITTKQAISLDHCSGYSFCKKMPTENITVKRNHHFTGSITSKKTLLKLFLSYALNMRHMNSPIFSGFYLEDILPHTAWQNHSNSNCFRNLMQFFEENKLKKNQKNTLGSWNMYCMSMYGRCTTSAMSSHLPSCVTQFLLSHLIFRQEHWTLHLISAERGIIYTKERNTPNSSIWQKIPL